MMCVSARSSCAVCEGFRARALWSKYRPGARVGRQAKSTGRDARKDESSCGALHAAIRNSVP
jgi:hypothetical protein